MDGLQFGPRPSEGLSGFNHLRPEPGQPLLVSGTLRLEHRDPLDQSFNLGGVCALKMPGVRGAYISLTLCHLDRAEVEAGPEQLKF